MVNDLPLWHGPVCGLPCDHGSHVPHVRLGYLNERSRRSVLVFSDSGGADRKNIHRPHSALKFRCGRQVLSLRVQLAPWNQTLLESGAGCSYARAVRKPETMPGAEPRPACVARLEVKRRAATLAGLSHALIITRWLRHRSRHLRYFSAACACLSAAEREMATPTLFDLTGPDSEAPAPEAEAM